MQKPDLKRRRLVRDMALCGGLATCNLPMAALAATVPLGIRPVSDRHFMITGAGGNVALYKGDNDITIIDSGRAEHTGQLVETIRTLAGDLPVTHLVNTHWHGGHSGGNAAIRALGANIIAHENTRLWLGAEFDVAWRHTHFEPNPPEALPDDTFYDSTQRELSGAWVHLLHYPQAHTDGDVVVYFPEANVLAAGGLVIDGRYPICDIATGGWIGGLIDAYQGIRDTINDNTVIITGEGGLLGKKDLLEQLAMFEDLYEQMKVMAQNGLSGQNMLDANVTRDYDGKYGDPTEFVLETYRGMWAHTYDMGGFI